MFNRDLIKLIALGIALPLVGYLLIAGALRPSTDADHEFRTLPNGEHLQMVMVLVTASSCAAANQPELREAIRHLRAWLANAVSHRGPGAFWSVGIAVDWDVQTGAEALGSFGEFDEIIVGGSWMNMGALRFVWNDSTENPALPQVVLLARKILRTNERIEIISQEELYRIVGPTGLQELNSATIESLDFTAIGLEMQPTASP